VYDSSFKRVWTINNQRGSGEGNDGRDKFFGPGLDKGERGSKPSSEIRKWVKSVLLNMNRRKALYQTEERGTGQWKGTSWGEERKRFAHCVLPDGKGAKKVGNRVSIDGFWVKEFWETWGGKNREGRKSESTSF